MKSSQKHLPAIGLQLACVDIPSCFQSGVASRFRQTLHGVRWNASQDGDGVGEDIRRKVTGDSSTRFRLTRMSCGGMDMWEGWRRFCLLMGFDVSQSESFLLKGRQLS